MMPMTGSVSYPAGYDYPITSLAQFVLETIISTYAARAEVATPLPSRHVVTVGSVAIDAPTLAVMFGGLSVGLPGNDLSRPFRSNEPRSADFNIELWRPITTAQPTGLPASAASISRSSEVTMQDTWLLLESAYACDQLGVGVIASTVIHEPQGDMIGVTMSLTLQVP